MAAITSAGSAVAAGAAKASLRGGRARNKAAATAATQAVRTRGFRVSKNEALGFLGFWGKWVFVEAALTSDSRAVDGSDHDDEGVLRKKMEETGLENDERF